MSRNLVVVYRGHSILDWQSMSQIWKGWFFFGSLSTINRHVFFCLSKKNFFTSIRFFEFSKKWYFRHSKRTFNPVYLEKNCSHEKFSKLRKLGFWLFFTEIVAKKLFKYFLTYKSKKINAKSFFSKFGPFRNFFLVFLDFLKSVIKYEDWIKMAGSLTRKLWNFEEPQAASRAIRALLHAASVLPGVSY